MLNDLLVFQVLGASWYCFSIQRTVACWYMACENHGGCVRNSFYYCDHNFGYHSVLDDFCPKNMPNAGLFDFGVFLDAHQSDILESKNIPQKIFYCFCWGMRNLRFAHIRLCTIPYEAFFIFLRRSILSYFNALNLFFAYITD